MASGDTIKTIPNRKVYEVPTLRTYGQLKDLTTGGSGTAQESSNGKKPRP